MNTAQTPERSRPELATARCVGRLQALYRRDNPAAVAALARLRRGAGHRAHDAPAGWGIDGLEYLAELREEAGAAPLRHFSREEARRAETRESREEEAVHVAVTLWALHQQSVHDADMHVRDWPLGRAVRRLAEHGRGAAGDGAGPDALGGGRPAPRPEDTVHDTLRKRFVRIGTSSSFDSLAVRLREMVLLLRGARIPLDYGRLAHQLWLWQDEERQADVRRAWGREFHLSYTRGPRDAEAGQAPDDPLPGYDGDADDSGE
ncbi:type I-E CRISPR-associated protein Cse2/CasB [Streptomyces sp. TRM 70351]|uniref:type I-E CRISPR-associated protein Cse2/CasB n=1 Tax=Streptomyces sp. TRM 70351 TaxID=3116552 RepID=UPI002E7B269A|nr:type I-E CRISPR-associated protein Cse2/CasB [Streptomyces sp. TRM 70351]MEE1927394.1 type I-E CRISPR-associated protein Cse2/CasB [Streptomyces sp. TRM 70351]